MRRRNNLKAPLYSFIAYQIIVLKAYDVLKFLKRDRYTTTKLTKLKLT